MSYGTTDESYRESQTVLVRLNGDWDAYWRCHRERQHARLYGTATLPPATAEDQALELAA